MAIFKRFTKQEIEEHFTHYGYFMGFVPVYLNMDNPVGPEVEVRNWYPNWLFDLAIGLFSIFTFMATFFNPEYVPLFKIKRTGEIVRIKE